MVPSSRAQLYLKYVALQPDLQSRSTELTTLNQSRGKCELIEYKGTIVLTLQSKKINQERLVRVLLDKGADPHIVGGSPIEESQPPEIRSMIENQNIYI